MGYVVIPKGFWLLQHDSCAERLKSGVLYHCCVETLVCLHCQETARFHAGPELRCVFAPTYFGMSDMFTKEFFTAAEYARALRLIPPRPE